MLAESHWYLTSARFKIDEVSQTNDSMGGGWHTGIGTFK